MGHKVVYCTEHGGFSLSPLAAIYLAGKGDQEASEWLAEIPIEETLHQHRSFYSSIPRHSPLLLDCINELGLEKTSGIWCSLEIAEIDGNRYIIQEYDGKEYVVEPKDIKWTKIEESPPKTDCEQDNRNKI